MVVVFGSINADLVATVAVLPREGETRTASGYAVHAGGKGANQALAARRAGARVTLVGAVGRDGFAEIALGTLRDAGVDLSGVAISNRPTGVALIHVDAQGRNTITVVPGANAEARSPPCRTPRWVRRRPSCSSSRFRSARRRRSRNARTTEARA
ncbi:MAG: hypothetical protein IPI87_05830 [Betaproteobacteria bacterium]|nr:hypothetical protein [Betaproteobacteria bacterium]